MSTSAPAKASPVEKKENGVDKLLRRMKTVFNKSDGSKRLSFSGRSKSVSGPSKPAATAPVAAAPETKVPEGAVKVMRSEIEAERNKKLAERFAITIEPLTTSTTPDKETYRIEKPVRMRIHRICHKCNTTYGGSKVCVECGHPRCTKCPRFPVKKPEGKGKASEAAAAAGPKGDIIEAEPWYGLKEDVPLTMPNPKPNGQPLVRKAPRQRVRRTCCKCQTLYVTGSKSCANCEHSRCTDCPRDPAKKKSYPDGYPGDAPSDDISKPIKYACHRCGKTYPQPFPHPDSEAAKSQAEVGVESPECSRCKHPKCAECPRAAPAKVDVAPDPEVLRSVQEKLRALSAV